MKMTAAAFAAMALLGASIYYFHVRPPQAQAPTWNTWAKTEIPRMKQQPCGPDQHTWQGGGVEEVEIDREIRFVMENGATLEERKRQVPAIFAVFAHRTELQRARRLAALCYLKTLGTPFMPIDIAEIALAETGNQGLSGKAVSPRGARGVWQLMPYRAKSHGYSPEEMENDQKCADAAVRELACKLAMANGNLNRAKKLYCGAGREANAYEATRQRCRREIMESLGDPKPVHGEGWNKIQPPPRPYVKLANW